MSKLVTYVTSNSSTPRALMEDTLTASYGLNEDALFRCQVGGITCGLEQRGEDTLLSDVLGVLALTADIVDFGVTAGFAAAYSVEQGITATTVVGALGGFAVGQVAYTSMQVALLGVDLFALSTASLSDFVTGRTAISLSDHEIAIGLDTLASAASLGISNVPLVVPGVYMGLTGDAAQLTYDYLRFSGTLEANSFVIHW